MSTTVSKNIDIEVDIEIEEYDVDSYFEDCNAQEKKDYARKLMSDAGGEMDNDEYVTDLVENLSMEQIFTVILDLDSQMEDKDFTRRLFEHFMARCVKQGIEMKAVDDIGNKSSPTA